MSSAFSTETLHHVAPEAPEAIVRVRLTLALPEGTVRRLREMAEQQRTPLVRVVEDAIENHYDLCTILIEGRRIQVKESAEGGKMVDVVVRRHVT